MSDYTVELTGKAKDDYIAKRFPSQVSLETAEAPKEALDNDSGIESVSVKETIEAYTAISANVLDCETIELLDYPRDLYEASHEHADGHEDVIYYSKAHDCVRGATAEEQEHAEQQMTDCCCYEDSPSYDTIATRLAFWIIEHRYTAAITEQLDYLTMWIEEQENEEEHEDALQAIADILGH